MRRLLPLVLAPFGFSPCHAREIPFAPPTARVADDRMDWWREARFGLFIHWGLYSTLEGEHAGNPNHAEWIRTTARIPLEEYDNLLARFNPVEFDADEWCRMAKDAGMRYIVITSKHHDGFALFDSRVSDFDVMATPFGRDIMKELSDAAARHGLRMCWYHSIMDWHHPDYLPRRDWEIARRPVGDADFARFVEFLHAQVRELLTNYGPVGVMWFDGEWEATWDREMGNRLYDLCREIQPDTIINNRVSKGRAGMAGMTVGEGFAGDFGTPEQEVPEGGLPGVDWESCITMNDHWGWNRADRAWKSSTDLIRMLIDVASKGGNLLLNVGPKPDGTFPPEAVERLAAIGDWMDLNPGVIHGTSASPFKSLPWGRCTMRDNHGRHRATTTLYLHVFDWPADGSLVVPGLGSDVLGARVLDGDSPRRLTFAREGGNVVLSGLPARPVHEASTTIEMEIRGVPIVYDPPEIAAPSDIFVRNLAIEITTPSEGLEVRYTIDGSDPMSSSPRWEGPITIAESTTVRAVSLHNGKVVSSIAERRFEKVEPWPRAETGRTSPGLIRSAYPGTFDRLPAFSSLNPPEQANVQDVSLAGGLEGREHVALVFEGYLAIPGDDLYAFSLASDDGARLLIDDHLVIDNDGLHEVLDKTGVAPLARGLHRIRVEWFNKTGGAELQLRMARGGSGSAMVPIHPSSYRH